MAQAPFNSLLLSVLASSLNVFPLLWQWILAAAGEQVCFFIYFCILPALNYMKYWFPSSHTVAEVMWVKSLPQSSCRLIRLTFGWRMEWKLLSWIVWILPISLNLLIFHKPLEINGNLWKLNKIGVIYWGEYMSLRISILPSDVYCCYISLRYLWF